MRAVSKILFKLLLIKFEGFFNEVIEGGVLTDKEKVVAILTAATVTGNEKLLKSAVLQARQIGFTKEELGHVNAIAIAVSAEKTRSLLDIKVETKPTSTCCE